MTTALRARLLGRPAFDNEGGAIACGSRKAIWLAAYVLHTGAVHSRAHLATLLWGGDSARHALGSLRVALTKLPPAMLAALEVTRESIGPAPGRAEVDTAAFVAGCTGDELQGLRRTAALYRGDLMLGAEDDLAPEFSDWLRPERARLRALGSELHARLAQRLHAQGERDAARATADAWLRFDPACEALHHMLMSWLPGDQAMAQYELYRRARAVAYGAPPSEAMAALADRVRLGADALRAGPQRLTAATSFIGRAGELAQLHGLLADPACRLLTLHGLGGVGKTRLAGAIAEAEAPGFADGVHVAALEGVHDPALFAPTLARACGLQPAGSASPLELVTSYLQARNALIVIDNLEHLLDGDPAAPSSVPAQLARLLAGTGARVKVLATSREPLGLQEEWVYEVPGFAHPRAEAGDAGDASAFAAVQFFAQRARQAHTAFSLEGEATHVARICELLEGLPLGLELAASWVRTVPCAQIAAGLAERALELRNRHVNRAARHDSLGAVVAYSWDRLAQDSREALCGLAALRGTFSREAAEHVAHAGLRTLTSLTEKSLLQRARGGRWHLHEVVRQFAWDQPDAAAKARPSRQGAINRRRDTFYLDYLRAAKARLDSADEPEAVADIEQEMPNIRAAWRSCAAGGDTEALEAAAPAWFEFLENHGYVEEGLRAADEWRGAAEREAKPISALLARIHGGHFQQMAADLPESLATLDAVLAALAGHDAPGVLAMASQERALTLSHLGRLGEAQEEAQRAIGLAEARDDVLSLARACTVMAIIVVRNGQAERARALGQRALAMAAATPKPSVTARLHNNLALAQNYLGEYAAAEAGYQAAFALWQEMRFTRFMGLAMHNLGVIAERVGDFALSLERYRRAFDLLARAGDRKMLSINLCSTGDSLIRIGRAAEARGPLDEALRIAERDGHGLPVPYSRVMLAHASVEQGLLLEAAGHLEAAFESAALNNFIDVLAEAVVVTARLVAAADAGPEMRGAALAWMRSIGERADASARVRRDARALAEVLGAGSRAPEDAVVPEGGLADLVRLARELLAALTPSLRDSAAAAPSGVPAATRA